MALITRTIPQLSTAAAPGDTDIVVIGRPDGPARGVSYAALKSALAAAGVGGEAADVAIAARIIAELARDLAQQAAADAAQVSGVSVPIYASVASAQAATIAAGVKSITVQYRAPVYGDRTTYVGESAFGRISLASIPSGTPATAYFRSTDRFMPDGTTDATNGGYWLLTGDVDTRALGAKGNRTLQQSVIQDALTASSLGGSTVTNVDGAWFNLRSLTLPRRVHFRYRVDDDRDTGFFSSDIGSGEQVLFSACSSYAPVDDGQGNTPNGAAVNEWRFTAPYHPGIVIDVRKDVTGHDAYLAPGQSRTHPARASLNIDDEQTGRWRVAYEHWGDSWSKYSAVRTHGWRCTHFLPGITAASWPTLPAVNDKITAPSGAAGYFLSADATGTTVEWITRRFQLGESPSNGAVTSTATLTAAAVATAAALPGMNISLRTGFRGIGMPAGILDELFTVGGDFTLHPTYSMGDYTEETVTRPGVVWRTDLESAPTAGASARHVNGENTARVWMHAGPKESASARGMLGAVCAAGRISSSLAVGDNCINILSIAKIGTGDYQVTFKRNMAGTAYITLCTMDGFYSGGYTAGGTLETTQTVRLKVYNNAGVLADIPTNGYINFSILGGDI